MRKWGPRYHDGHWTIGTWAPSVQEVSILLPGRDIACTRDAEGFWTATVAAEAGTPYRFRVGGRDVPDPASRLQLGDVHGPSVLFDPGADDRTGAWAGRDWAEAVIYELHIGTFTPEGTFAAAAEKLEGLAALGITAIEIMPVGQWAGGRGWGYDGVLPFAPHPAYGTPGDLKALVTRAHEAGLMVLLDLVMNHFGPEGAYLHATAPQFFNAKRHTPWGAAIDFSRDAVRAFWIECALMWLGDYRLDGLRLDAVHQITGPGADGFFTELAGSAAALEKEAGRPLHLIVEDERNEPQLRESGYRASWNDDFHHAVHTALTGESQDYYASFAVNPIGDLARALERGHIEEGQDRKGRDTPRGAPSAHLPTTAFVNSTQTHDQVGNRARGERLLGLVAPDGVEVAYALLLVSPFIPMIFMGEERGETAPFQFFADFGGELGRMVREGRAAEFSEILALGADVPDPLAYETFERSKLGWRDTPQATRWLETTRRCLDFRARAVVPLLKSGRSAPPEARLAGEKAIAARWAFHGGTLDLALNFGGVGAFAHAFDAPLTINDISQDPFALAIEAHPR